MASNYEYAIQWVEQEAEAALEGQGGHDATFKAACMLFHGFDLSEVELQSALNHYNLTKCSPAWSVRELGHKARQAMKSGSKYPRGWAARQAARAAGELPPLQPKREVATPAPQFEPKWKLPFDYSALARYARKELIVDEQWFIERSPVNPSRVSPLAFVESLFCEGEKVLVFDEFRSQGQYIIWVGKGVFRLGNRPEVKAVRAELPRGGKDGVWFLAQPVDGKWHPVEEAGKFSRRSQASVVEQRFLLLECDHRAVACPCKDCKGRDNPNLERLWMNFLAQLPLPVVAIYSSGGKSWHALVKMSFPSKAHLDAFKRNHGGMFSKLGADARAWSPTQLTRLPGMMRGDRLQKLIYLNPNPEPSGTPIYLGGNEPW